MRGNLKRFSTILGESSAAGSSSTILASSLGNKLRFLMRFSACFCENFEAGEKLPLLSASAGDEEMSRMQRRIVGIILRFLKT